MAKEAAPHVLVFPFPAQGHVSPMLKLAEHLSLSSINTTFVNTDHIHSRYLQYSSSSALHRPPNHRRAFRFRTIPDGFPTDHPRPLIQVLDLEQSMRANSREFYMELLVPTGGSGSDPDGWPPVTCVVADGILPLALEVPEEIGIPVMIFRASSACSMWTYSCIDALVKTGEIPFPDDPDLDEEIEGVKGMERILRRRDLPSFIREAKSTTDPGLQFASTISANLTRGVALILNTFEPLEAATLARIRSKICPAAVYTVGPLEGISPSLWRADRACMKWLDAQPQKSVVYVSFGSIAVVSTEELLELWHGLVNSGHRFLWVVRPGLVDGQIRPINDVITPELQEESNNYCLVEWASQEEVLAHPAVGCFLTHSGWNSTLESLAAGVPMICWPCCADQMVISRFVSEVWRVGVDMKDGCERSVVEKMVKEAMDGDRAEEMRRTVRETARAAKKSTENGGSSHASFQRLVHHIKCLSLQKTNSSDGDPVTNCPHHPIYI